MTAPLTAAEQAAAEAPTPETVVEAGWRAVNAYSAAEASAHGVDTRNQRVGPRHTRYWTPAATSSLEEHVVEREALWQILSVLPTRQRQALTALAATDDYALAAEGLGLSYGSYQSSLQRGRVAFYRWWHEGEIPSRIWRKDKRVERRIPAEGRLTAAALERIRARHLDGETLTALAAEHGVHRDTLRRLLTGRHRPAHDSKERA